LQRFGFVEKLLYLSCRFRVFQNAIPFPGALSRSVVVIPIGIENGHWVLKISRNPTVERKPEWISYWVCEREGETPGLSLISSFCHAGFRQKSRVFGFVEMLK
jgi:hypothetical protein